MRAARRAQAAFHQHAHSARVCARIEHGAWFRACHTLSAYWPVDGELDLRPLLARACALGKQVYLPVVDASAKRLRFARYLPERRLHRSHYGLSEPRAQRGELIAARRLDLVLMPVLGFDDDGTRLGLGGGYYDRSFACVLGSSLWRRPRLVGVAFELQHLDTLERAPWDVPVDAIVTERRCYRYRRRPE